MPIASVLPGESETTTRTKVNAAIDGVNDLTSEPAARSSADAALQTNINAEVTARGAAVGAEAKARSDADAALSSRLDASEIYSRGALYPAMRPGDAPGLFTGSRAAVADPGAYPALSPGSIVASDEGLAYRLSSAGYCVTRRMFPIEPDRLYTARCSVKRSANPSDPSGDTIRFGLLVYSAAKALIADLAVADLSGVTVTSGRMTARALVTRQNPQPGYLVLPATARYVRAYVQTFGGDQATDIDTIDIADAPPTINDIKAITDALAAFVAAAPAIVQYVGDQSVQPSVVDGAGHILRGRNAATGQNLPSRIFPRRKRRIIGSYGQSLRIATTALLLRAATKYPNALRTFASGMRSTRLNNPWGVPNLQSPGQTAEAALFEDTGNAWGDGSIHGTSGMMDALEWLIEREARDGLPVGSTTYFPFESGRGSQLIVSLFNLPNFGLMLDAMRAAKALADTAGETSEMPFICYGQGEANTIANPVTPREAYAPTMIALAKQINSLAVSIFDQAVPCFFLYFQTCHRMVPSVGAIALGQRDAERACPLIKMTTPIWHIVHATDRLHLTAEGYVVMGRYDGRAMYNLSNGRDPDVLSLQSIVYDPGSNRIVYRYKAPTPMVFDTVTWSPATQLGFRVFDKDGDVGLTSPTLSDDGLNVLFTPSRAPDPATATGNVAMDYLSSSIDLAPSGCASANLRDQTNDPIGIGGTTYQTWNVAAADQMKLIAFG